MIVSIVFRMVQDFLKDHKFLPPVLFLNLDNCGRENKVKALIIINLGIQLTFSFQNRYLLAFLCALVELGVFREIVVYFLLVGRTGKGTKWDRLNCDNLVIATFLR